MRRRRGAPSILPPGAWAIFPRTMRTLRLFALGALAGAAAACPSPDTTRKAMDALTAGAVVPDTLPILLNKESPFRYPDALYSSKVQGNVMLRIYIDSTGTVWPESTLVLQSSGHPEFDSAAVRGAPRLHFLPAKLKNDAGRRRDQAAGLLPPAGRAAGAGGLGPQAEGDRHAMSGNERNRRPYESVLDTIGWTPLIRLTRVTKGLRTPVYGKAEFFNPGGSVKDRIGLPIIERAERDGSLKPGGTIVEGTSGNTGVGLAIAAALKGYRCIFTMPDKMSQEKVRLLKAFGAEVIITPTAVPPDHPDNYVMMAKRIAKETPNAILANQFYNRGEPAGALRDHGSGALGADRRADHALRGRGGHRAARSPASRAT